MAKGGKGSKGAGGGGEIMRQAARMQRRMDEVRKQLKDREVSMTGAGEKVTVTVTCAGRIRRIEADPAFLESEGLEMTLDAVVATCNAALELADSTSQGEFEKVTGGMKIPGVTG